jgi:methionyl-tRNA synthetase
LNLYIDQTKPWALAKAAAGTDSSASVAREELREVLFTLMEGIRWTATAFLPILPNGMLEVFRQLGVPPADAMGGIEKLEWGNLGIRPGEPKPIYPRIELPKEEGV